MKLDWFDPAVSEMFEECGQWSLPILLVHLLAKDFRIQIKRDWFTNDKIMPYLIY